MLSHSLNLGGQRDQLFRMSLQPKSPLDSFGTKVTHSKSPNLRNRSFSDMARPVLSKFG
jgi:hypothetical protein